MRGPRAPPGTQPGATQRATWAQMARVGANFRQDGATKAQLGPTWAEFGPNLGPTWAIFGVVFGLLVVWLPMLVFSSLRALVLGSCWLLFCFVLDAVHKAADAKSTVKTKAKSTFCKHRFQGKGCSTVRKTKRRELDNVSCQWQQNRHF